MPRKWIIHITILILTVILGFAAGKSPMTRVPNLSNSDSQNNPIGLFIQAHHGLSSPVHDEKSLASISSVYSHLDFDRVQPKIGMIAAFCAPELATLSLLTLRNASFIGLLAYSVRKLALEQPFIFRDLLLLVGITIIFSFFGGIYIGAVAACSAISYFC